VTCLDVISRAVITDTTQQIISCGSYDLRGPL